MSSEWSWCAGFVFNSTQDSVKKAIVSNIEALTNKVMYVASDAEIDPGNNFVVVAPERGGTVTFWLHSWRLCVWIFHLSGFSGVVAHVFRDGLADSLRSTLDKYSYCSFDNGVLTDWFVSNLRYEFDGWGWKAIQDILTPYLERQLSEEEFVRVDYSDLVGLVNRYSDLFNSHQITTYCKANTPTSESNGLFRLRDIGDLYERSAVIDLPFFGPDYDIYSLAGYFQRQKFPDRQSYYPINTLNAERRKNERSTEWLKEVSLFAPISFNTRGRREMGEEQMGRIFTTFY